MIRRTRLLFGTTIIGILKLTVTFELGKPSR